MQAMRISHPGPAEERPLQLVDVPVPRPGDGQVLLQVSVCGVCHTDLHILEGEIHPPRFPLIPGHQIVGRIAELGAGVAGWQVGERAGVPWLHSTCGHCFYCRRGQENLCSQARFTGFDCDGGFGEYSVADAGSLLRLPAGVADVQAAPLLCAGIVGYRSLQRAEVQAGDRLGLIGFGASAHLALQVARSWGCEVYVLTRAEEHRRHALELGAVWAGGIEDPLPHPLDAAVLFAPNGRLIPSGLKVLRPGGTLAVNAIHTSPIPEMPYGLLYGERTLRSVANATHQDGVEFLELAGRISLQVDVQPYALADANQALLDLKNSRLRGEAVLKMTIDRSSAIDTETPHNTRGPFAG